jgi:ABC-type uncharacterized transport system permease subunit
LEQLTIILFWLALVCGVLSSLGYSAYYAAKADRWIHNFLGFGGATLAFILLLAVIFTRALALGVTNTAGPFTVSIIISAFIIGIFLLIEAIYAGRSRKVKALGMFMLPMAVVIQYAAWHTYKLTRPLTEQLRSVWVGIHVTFAVLAYASMTVALALALIYWLQERQLRNMHKKKPGKIFRKLPSLEVADDIGSKTIAFSFTFLTLVLATGAIRAEMLPQWAAWYQDPKILMAAATWVVYGSYLLVRTTLGWQGKRANIFAILGFVVAIATYLIGNSSFVQQILPTVHSYGGGLG